jgi:hypothetical protein
MTVYEKTNLRVGGVPDGINNDKKNIKLKKLPDFNLYNKTL